MPDRAAGIVGDEQRTVLGDGERGRTSPDFSALLARYPEAGDEVLVVVLRPSVLERHAHHLVAGGLRAIPGPLERDERTALVLRRELFAFVENQIHRRRMRLEQQIGSDRRVHFLRCKAGETGLRVLADIGIGPAVETSILYVREIIGRQVVT